MRIVGHHETQGPHDVRGRPQKDLSLLQGLAHEPDMQVLEIAQAPMNQLRAGRGGVGGQIVLLAQED